MGAASAPQNTSSPAQFPPVLEETLVMVAQNFLFIRLFLFSFSKSMVMGIEDDMLILIYSFEIFVSGHFVELHFSLVTIFSSFCHLCQG